MAKKYKFKAIALIRNGETEQCLRHLAATIPDKPVLKEFEQDKPFGVVKFADYRDGKITVEGESIIKMDGLFASIGYRIIEAKSNPKKLETIVTKAESVCLGFTLGMPMGCVGLTPVEFGGEILE